MVLDDLDRRILAYLQEDGRISYVTLAAELGVSEGTIRKRVRKLEKDEVFQTVGITDPFRVGLDTVAFAWLEVERGKLESVMESLKRLEAVRYLVVTTGSHDLVAMVVLPDRQHLIELLNDKFSTIPGIISTETSIVLQIHKQIHDWVPFRSRRSKNKGQERLTP